MDAQKIEHVCRNEQQGIYFSLFPFFPEESMEPFHGVGCLVRRNRSEAGNFRAISSSLGNLIVGHLPEAALLGDELAKIAMELKNNASSERHVGMVGVNRCERIPVTGNLLFGTIPRCRLVLDEFFDPVGRCLDSFNTVGGFGALNDRDLAQGFEYLRCLLFEKGFLSPIFAQQADGPQKRVGNEVFLQEIRIQMNAWPNPFLILKCAPLWWSRRLKARRPYQRQYDHWLLSEGKQYSY